MNYRYVVIGENGEILSRHFSLDQAKRAAKKLNYNKPPAIGTHITNGYYQIEGTLSNGNLYMACLRLQKEKTDD